MGRYGSAKEALESTCRYFAVALARNGITVNAVSPGASDETTLIGQAPKEVQNAIKDWVHAGLDPYAQTSYAFRRCKCVRAVMQ